jgi:hypothetical protein
MKLQHSRQPSTGRPSTHSLLPIVLQLTLLLSILHTGQGQGICDTTPTSWDELVSAIDTYGGYLFLCPFTINGDKCPSSQGGYAVKSEVYLLCEPSHSGNVRKGCVIDCPGTHFDVRNQGLLFLDGVTFSGSTSSAIRVRHGGTLTAYNSIFEG